MRAKRSLAIAIALALSLSAPAVIEAQQEPPRQGAAQQDLEQPPAEASAEGAEPTQPPAPPPPAPPAVAPEPVTGATAIRATASATSSVSVGDYFYRPSRLTVDIGENVLWTNNGKVDEGHTVTGDGFDSGVMDQGDTYSHSFAQSGTYPYICTLHPNMKGTVVVSGGSTSPQENDDAGRSGGSAGSNAGSAAGGSSAGEGVASPAFGPAEGSAGNGGNGRTLPASGSDSLLLALYGIVLIELGLALNLISRQGLARRRRG